MDTSGEVQSLRQKLADCERSNKEVADRIFSQDFVSSHKNLLNRRLGVRLKTPAPVVLISILAKQKEKSLPLYLKCIEKLDYPKESIVVYIRTNNNRDRTKELLLEWVGSNRALYKHIDVDASDLDPSLGLEKYDVHEWNTVRFRTLATIRRASLLKTIEHGCDFYFVCDVDNFIVPWTLRNIVSCDVPIVAPFLRNFNDLSFDSNFFTEVGDDGYYRENHPLYFPVLTQSIRGIIETKLVHHTYLIRRDVLDPLIYDDGSGRYEFVVFSDSARKAGISQYIDNRCIYGYITTGDEYGYAPGDREHAEAAGSAVSQVGVTEKIMAEIWLRG